MRYDLWWQLLPTHPDERTLLIGAVVLCFFMLWIGNLLLHKQILKCPFYQLMRFELFCVGFLGLINIITSSLATQQNAVTRLSNKYVFGRSHRYTANAPINSVIDYCIFGGMLLFNLIILALLLQRIDQPRNALYNVLMTAGFSSPYITTSTPITQVNVVFVSTSHLCVVAQSTAGEDTTVLPVGRYAPFIWRLSPNNDERQLMSIEQSKSSHPAVQLAPVTCDDVRCRTHLDIRPGMAPVIIGYDNVAALSQLEVFMNQWYVSAVPRQSYEGMYFVEIRADGIQAVEPAPVIHAMCAS
jgi:hypothetical protein